ncbi:MAG: LptF/LptG family permease [Alphaproteobacteria bacterium]|nr:LptF/LptG family permease [Alphaproteobacteria bacterium]
MELRRYIFKQMLYWVVVSTASLIGIVWLSQALKLIELLVNKGAALTDFLVLTVLAIPLWLMVILPIGGLIATILVLNRLQQDREITAMHAVGLSNFSIARGPLLMGLMLTVFMYINSAFILPLTFSGYKSIINSLRTSAPIIILQEGVFTDVTKGLTMFIETRQGQKNFSNIFVHDTRKDNKIVEIIAESGSIDLETTPPRLNFFNGIRSEYSLGDSQAAVLEFDSYELSLTREYKNLVDRASDYNELPISVLLNGDGASAHYSREMRAEGHYRLASPVLGLTLVVIGIASILNSRYSRTGSWRQICVGAAVAIVVEVLLVMARGVAINTPSLFPLMYIISILPAIIGLYLLRQKSRMVKVVA